MLLLSLVWAHLAFDEFQNKPVLADLSLAKSVGLQPVIEDPDLGVGYFYLNGDTARALSEAAHGMGRCGSFSSLDLGDKHLDVFTVLEELRQATYNERASSVLKRNISLDFKEEIADATKMASANNLRNWVTWLSSYPNRYHRSSTPDRHVDELKIRLENLLKDSGMTYEVQKIAHRSTPQSSLMVRILGKSKPNEIVVLGGHLDSIVQWSPNLAPGADDNASGSSNVIEALEILVKLGHQPERTLEFFWYGGEEAGLLGSAEIANAYKAEGRDVVAVMQLDMTLFPGEGEGIIGSISDNTSSWLRDFVSELNRLYVGVEIRPFPCGYGCSDHASWFKKGYSTVAPFEATMNTINRNIHTTRDVISDAYKFEHSAQFSKLAVAYLMEMGNSNIR